MKQIDFVGLNRILLSTSLSFLQEILPGGRQVGSEYVCAGYQGGEGRSLSINLTTGIFRDFADSAKGGADLIALYARVRGIKNGEAARQLEKQYGNGNNGYMPAVREREPVQQKPAIVVPDGTPAPDFYHPSHGPSIRQFRYTDRDGRTLFYIARYELPTGKTFCPYSFDSVRWNKYGWPNPQPLYGLEDLLRLRPNAGVIVVEGESSAEAQRKLSPDAVVVTWVGGANRWNSADWTVLYGRRVVFFPDNDAPGLAAMMGIARLLRPHCQYLKILDVSDRPEKSDAADMLADGWTISQFTAWTQSRVRDIPAEVVAPQPQPYVATVTGPDGPIERSNGHHPMSFDAAWLRLGLSSNGNGQPHPNIENAVAVLLLDEEWVNRVWYDSFEQKFMTGEPAREWTDGDDIELAFYCQHHLGIPKMGTDTIRAAVHKVATQHPRNSLRDWIDKLEWDGISRLEDTFVDHYGAENTEYVRSAGRVFWLSMVARVYRPGCKLDTMIVLEGHQGRGKSMSLHTIGDEKLHTEQHESVNGKGFFEVLQGKLIIEIGEMDAFTRADITKVKQVVTCSTDRYREPYERRASDHPRQCIFIGTTNRDDYLKDETGGRRFLPIRTSGDIDNASLELYRDQYFAEAKHRLNPGGGWNKKLRHFNGGEDWWTMPHDATRAEQRERLQEEPWQEYIQQYIHFEKIGDRVQRRITPLTTVTVNEILRSVLSVEIGRTQRADERRVGACLTSLGWRKRTGLNETDPDNPHFGKVWKYGGDA